MDLGAYGQIENLETVMVQNGITVPRLRGLRLMIRENPVSHEEISESGHQLGVHRCEELCECDFRLDANSFENSSRTRKIKKKYLIYTGKHDNIPADIRWDNIHGKKRKIFKYAMRKAINRYKRQMETFNKYCGRPDILYIHARIGGGNWPFYRKEVENQPWFIEKADDAFDRTYCDIYAKINSVEQSICRQQ